MIDKENKALKIYKIYCIAEGINGPCKIGKAKNVKDRLHVLQTGNSRPLAIYYVIETSNTLMKEKRLHEIYRKQRLFGEWYDMSVDEAKIAIDNVFGQEFDNIELRTNVFQLRVSPEEKTYIEFCAKQNNMSVSEWLRKLAAEWKRK